MPLPGGLCTAVSTLGMKLPLLQGLGRMGKQMERGAGTLGKRLDGAVGPQGLAGLRALTAAPPTCRLEEAPIKTAHRMHASANAPVDPQRVAAVQGVQGWQLLGPCGQAPDRMLPAPHCYPRL